MKLNFRHFGPPLKKIDDFHNQFSSMSSSSLLSSAHAQNVFNVLLGMPSDVQLDLGRFEILAQILGPNQI